MKEKWNNVVETELGVLAAERVGQLVATVPVPHEASVVAGLMNAKRSSERPR